MEDGIDTKRHEYSKKYPLGELKMRRILCYNEDNAAEEARRVRLKSGRTMAEA